MKATNERGTGGREGRVEEGEKKGVGERGRREGKRGRGREWTRERVCG